jgi:hypothetical protein
MIATAEFLAIGQQPWLSTVGKEQQHSIEAPATIKHTHVNVFPINLKHFGAAHVLASLVSLLLLLLQVMLLLLLLRVAIVLFLIQIHSDKVALCICLQCSCMQKTCV